MKALAVIREASIARIAVQLSPADLERPYNRRQQDGLALPIQLMHRGVAGDMMR